MDTTKQIQTTKPEGTSCSALVEAPCPRVTEVSIVIVNSNSADFLAECLASIRAYTHAISYEVIVVDNASTKDDLSVIRRKYPYIHLIESRENLGFARANNLGFQNSTGEYVLFLNPDTQLKGPAIEVMLAEIRRLPSAGILGCRVLNPDLSVQLSSIQAFPTILNQVLDTEYLQLRWPHWRLWKIAPLFGNGAKPVTVEAISGACLLAETRGLRTGGKVQRRIFHVRRGYRPQLQGRLRRIHQLLRGERIHHPLWRGSSSKQKVSYWATIMRYGATWQFLERPADADTRRFTA